MALGDMAEADRVFALRLAGLGSPAPLKGGVDPQRDVE